MLGWNVRPDIVTIGGKLCALRKLTAAEYELLRLNYVPRDGVPFHLWLPTATGQAVALALMYGVSIPAAREHLDGEARRLELALAAGGYRCAD